MNFIRKGVWYHHCAQCFTDLCIGCPGVDKEDVPKIVLPQNKSGGSSTSSSVLAPKSSMDVLTRMNRDIIIEEKNKEKLLMKKTKSAADADPDKEETKDGEK
jgi:hypothetical protein